MQPSQYNNFIFFGTHHRRRAVPRRTGKSGDLSRLFAQSQNGIKPPHPVNNLKLKGEPNVRFPTRETGYILPDSPVRRYRETDIHEEGV